MTPSLRLILIPKLGAPEDDSTAIGGAERSFKVEYPEDASVFRR